MREGQEKLTLAGRGLHAAGSRRLAFLAKIGHHGDGDDVGRGESRVVVAAGPREDGATPLSLTGFVSAAEASAGSRSTVATIAANTDVMIDSLRIFSKPFWSWIRVWRGTHQTRRVCGVHPHLVELVVTGSEAPPAREYAVTPPRPDSSGESTNRTY